MTATGITVAGRKHTPAGAIQRLISQYGRGPSCVVTTRAAIGSLWSWPIATHGITGSSRMSWSSKNVSKRRRSCRRPSLCDSHWRWRMLVCCFVTATGSSPAADGELLDLRRAEAARDGGGDERVEADGGLRQVEPGRDLVLDPAAGLLETVDEAVEGVGDLGIERAGGVVEPRRHAERRRGRSARGGGSSRRHAGLVPAIGPAHQVEGQLPGRPAVRAIGPATAMSAWVSVPGGPGIWPWAGTMP